TCRTQSPASAGRYGTTSVSPPGTSAAIVRLPTPASSMSRAVSTARTPGLFAGPSDIDRSDTRKGMGRADEDTMGLPIPAFVIDKASGAGQQPVIFKTRLIRQLHRNQSVSAQKIDRL